MYGDRGTSHKTLTVFCGMVVEGGGGGGRDIERIGGAGMSKLRQDIRV